MNKSIVLGTSLILSSVILNPAVMSTANADIVATHEVVAEQQSGLNRAQLTEQLQREDVREQLVRFGVDPEEAIARVASMTDQEVMELTAGIEQMPAGAGVSVSVSVILIAILIWLIFFR
ncbi:PA2779 family protein [Aliidiomarina indica]|uniref:PA2779 family protein n=1 Tax=Aliidiomarina indica TaxID=2749147 RepID=UPI0018907CE9|nr:PA2779 family protein [Aliidiomarina indica]